MGLTTTQLTAWTSVDLSYTGGSVSGINYNNVIEILDYARTHTGSDATADEMANLIFVTKMVNPAYFDAYGFLGTCMDASNDGTCDQGTRTTKPTGYDALDINAVSADVPDPYDVKNLLVNFL